MTISTRMSLRFTAMLISALTSIATAQPTKAATDVTSHRLGYPRETIYRPDCSQHVAMDCVPRCRRPDETKTIIFGTCEIGSLR